MDAEAKGKAEGEGEPRSAMTPGARRPVSNDEDDKWGPPKEEDVVTSGDEGECERCGVGRGRRGMSEHGG